MMIAFKLRFFAEIQIYFSLISGLRTILITGGQERKYINDHREMEAIYA